eukprot:TRINITY_DN4712_c0_g1_i1.p1 TRINITY_DN4712_c0_g1~~TRINITY_DN4712_c0_g1_i1.p1  ORF type:complete len:143 (-),score=4.02 TRINITY_DN4712_c0_g1_i1:183-566(-)
MSLIANLLKFPLRSRAPLIMNNVCNSMRINPVKMTLSTSTVRCQDEPSPAESNLIKVLAERFPKATDIAVVDISGGCGSMYEVYVEAPDFKGMRIVKQHKLVTEALKKEIGDMHGIRISTNASPCQH